MSQALLLFIDLRQIINPERSRRHFPCFWAFSLKNDAPVCAHVWLTQGRKQSLLQHNALPRSPKIFYVSSEISEAAMPPENYVQVQAHGALRIQLVEYVYTVCTSEMRAAPLMKRAVEGKQVLFLLQTCTCTLLQTWAFLHKCASFHSFWESYP